MPPRKPVFPQSFHRPESTVEILGHPTRFIHPGILQTSAFQEFLLGAIERSHLSRIERDKLTPIEKQGVVLTRLQHVTTLVQKTQENTATPEEMLESYTQIATMFKYSDLNALLLSIVHECFPGTNGIALSDEAIGSMFSVLVEAIMKDPDASLALTLGQIAKEGRS
jgi:hypothetical protein